MNTNSYKATDYRIDNGGLERYFCSQHSHNYLRYTCECCISVCSYDSPSVHLCHTFVSVTYLPKAGISETFEQPTLCFDKGE